jgi:hypothetical protein
MATTVFTKQEINLNIVHLIIETEASCIKGISYLYVPVIIEAQFHKENTK